MVGPRVPKIRFRGNGGMLHSLRPPLRAIALGCLLRVLETLQGALSVVSFSGSESESALNSPVSLSPLSVSR